MRKLSKKGEKNAYQCKALFHFTSFDSLRNILKKKFHPNYCAEDPEQLKTKIDSLFPNSLIPMLCFCDLSLSSITNHIKKYGSYGIGLIKNWGIEKGLNPVLYLAKEGEVSQLLDEILKIQGGLIRKQKGQPGVVGESWKEADVTIQRLLAFLKPIKGRRFRNGSFERKETQPTKFYDEKEWRYVPKEGFNIRLITKDPMPMVDLNKVWDEPKHRIDFEPADIKYLIVRYETQIYDFTKFIDKIYKDNGSVSEEEILKLKTKIISVENIKEDF